MIFGGFYSPPLNPLVKKSDSFDRGYGPWPWPCLRAMSMAMAMPTDHGHGHAYGPWSWPCLGTPDQGPSSVEEKEREREIGQPASLKKQSPVT